MQISQLFLRNFGKFENLSIDFTPGLNIIKGPNEAGKSTLAEAVTAAFFMNPEKNSDQIKKIVKWRCDDAPSLMAVLNTGTDSFKLIKDFSKGVTELVGDKAASKEKSGKDVDDWLTSQLGMSSEEIFKATACINQGEMNQIEGSIGAIQGKLESLVTGGREDEAGSMIIEKIEQRIRAITGPDGVSGKELARINEISKDIDYNIEKLSRDIATLRTRRADLIQVEVAYKNVKEDLLKNKDTFEKNKKATKLEQEYQARIKECTDLEAKSVEAKESIKKIKEYRDRQAQAKKIESKDIKELETIETNLNYLQPKKRELEEDVNEATLDYHAYHIGIVYYASTGIGILGSVASAVFYWLNVFSGIAPYSLALSIGLFVLGVVACISRRQHRAYLKNNLEKQNHKLGELDFEINHQSELLKDILRKYLVSSTDDLKRNLWQNDELENQVAREKERYDSLIHNSTSEEIDKTLDQLNQQIANMGIERKDLVQYVVDESEVNRQQLIIDQFQERINDLERERAVLRSQIETAEGGTELLSSYIERKAELKSRAEDLLHEVAILGLTVQCVTEARQNVLVSTLEVLNGRTSEILGRLTSGKYSKVRFDKSNLKFEVYSEDKKEWVDPESELSAGTVDQIYLAARLALADLISEDRYPVMILDDPFVNYDGERLENAMKIIKEMSQNHQILLLTSQDNFDKWADSTIVLPK